MGEQGSGDKGGHLGDNTGDGGATDATAAADILRTGRSASAGRDVVAGRDIGSGRDVGAWGGILFQFWTTDSTTDAGKGEDPQRQVTTPAGSGGYNGEGELGFAGGKNPSAPDTATTPSGVHSPSVSSDRSADGELSAEGSKTSSLDESSPVTTIARAVALNLESHLHGSRVREELGRTRTQM